MLQVKSLTFEYTDKLLFQNVNFEVKRGELLHLRGANGAGKTTLLRLLTGILQPLGGTIYYANQSIEANLPDYQRKLCYVGHKAALNPLLSIEENCRFDTHWRQQCNLDELLTAFLPDVDLTLPCHHLSAGQQRRVALLRLAMTDASLWLLDEPFVALDSASINGLSQLLQQHLLKGGQIILTSHQELPASLSIDREFTLS